MLFKLSRPINPLPNSSTPGSHRIAIADLNPSYFALVMATGIVSISCGMLGMPRLSMWLFWLNVAVYLTLVSLTAVRIVLFPRRFLTDLLDHKRGVGYFTTVAASGVLGNQFLLMAQQRLVATILWGISVVLGFIITYTLFTAFAVKRSKPSLPDGIHGGWLLAVVAVQSISVLGTSLASGFGIHAGQILFFALTMWLVGGMLYLWIISLIFYRYSFFPMTPGDLSPPYWINMGAMAISTLAGATLIATTESYELLRSIAPFLKGFTLLFWATATWWIPMLVILGIWRHGYMRYRLAYDPQYWGAVFPLGMYTAATFRLANILNLPFLLVIPNVFIYVAITAWTLVFTAMLWSLVATVLREIFRVIRD